MKRFLLFFLFLPFTAHAQTYTQEAARVCAGTRWVAKDVMTRRQSGEPYERVMRDMQNQSTANNKARGIDMVNQAYSIPPVFGQAQKMVIDGFADQYYVDCLNKVSGIN